MTEETPYKNQPDLERSGKMGTEEKPSSPQEMTLRTQYKCTKDGQIFSSQMELNNHYRALHGMQAPDQQKESGLSSESGNEMSDTATGKMTDENEENAENEKSEATGAQGSKGKWDELSKEKDYSMKENKDASKFESGEYGKSSQNQTQGQYKCEKDEQIFSSQEELDQHNREIHNMETKELGSELEEKDKESMDEREESVSGYESKNSSGELSKENWSKQDRENDWMNQKNKTETNDQRMEYNKSSQSSEGQYRCQRDGQVFSSQEELNQHNQKAHNMDSQEKDTEL